VKAGLSAVPASLRLTRRGDVFTLFAARPGEEPQEAGSVVVAFEGPVYAGLAVCSHETGVLETAVFSNLRLEGK
jgi:hypothetical protein